jgi:hypothetical protein
VFVYSQTQGFFRVRYKAIITAVAAVALFWGPSIGSSGMTDAVTTGVEMYRSVFGWHTQDSRETQQLSDLNAAVFDLAAQDSRQLFETTATQ